jgi:parallel beta-helix repeat protein
MKKLHALAIVFGLALVALIFVLGVVSEAPVLAAPSDRPLQDPGDCTVTTTDDSGAGSLRDCMAQLGAGDTITFSTSVFPVGNPASIVLTNELPYIVADNVTIDGSDAGVILDGSGIGTTPVTVLLDDVSLRLDGGPDLISNGDFTTGLGHWRPWDDGPGATRYLSSDPHSPPNAYGWDTVAHAGGTGTVYDTVDTSEPFDVSPFEEDSTAWISASGGSTAELRFWYKYGGVRARLRALFPDGHRERIDTWDFPPQVHWTEEVITDALPDGAIAISLEFKFSHWQSGTRGLVILGADDVVIKGLQIVSFPGIGIELSNGASDNTIGGTNNSPGGACSGECNLISDNGDYGVLISGSGTMSNTVSGNYIGTDINGTVARANRSVGVNIFEGSQWNTVGGDTDGKRNLISGNIEEGVVVGDSGTDHNRVIGNYIGTDVSGTLALGNGEGGVDLESEEGDPAYNIIEGNLISGNTDNGLELEGGTNNSVIGNYIGTNVLGTASIGNWQDGIWIADSAHSNLITGNLISGNDEHGVEIRDAANNTVSDNLIGTDIFGTRAIGNGWSGVDIANGAIQNTIGVSNIIAFNERGGVTVAGSSTLGNKITQNSIHSNRGMGIDLSSGGNTELPGPDITDNNLAGGTASGTACANCTVEIYSDDHNEGRLYEGTSITDAGGHWTFSKGSPLTGPTVTATATDPQGNTSEFSFSELRLYLPLILKNAGPPPP